MPKDNDEVRTYEVSEDLLRRLHTYTVNLHGEWLGPLTMHNRLRYVTNINARQMCEDFYTLGQMLGLSGYDLPPDSECLEDPVRGSVVDEFKQRVGRS